MGMKELSERHVLVVEDEYFIAEDIARILRESGADVLGPAGDIEQAMRLVASGERIDAAVLDVNVHGRTTYAIADALRRRGVPFLFATGYDDGHLPSEYSDVPRCRKPLNWRALVTSVSGLLRSPPAG
jgi:CheY-like chemotaxis protein